MVPAKIRLPGLLLVPLVLGACELLPDMAPPPGSPEAACAQDKAPEVLAQRAKTLVGFDDRDPALLQADKAAAQQFLTEQGLMRPEVMAIGDSLYNGVRSLTISRWLSDHSVPSLVALRLGALPIDRQSWNRINRYDPAMGQQGFFGPPYPDSVTVPIRDGASETRPGRFGLDLEQYLETGASLSEVFGRQGNGFGKTSYVLYETPNGTWSTADGPAVPHNLAYLSGRVDHLLTLTPARAEAILTRAPLPDNAPRPNTDLAPWQVADPGGSSLIERMRGSSAGGFSDFGEGFFLTNARFVLNPYGLKAFQNLTAVEQVLLRQPKRLLISIGANHGVYRFAFEGRPLSGCAYEGDSEHRIADLSIAQAIGPHFLAQAEALIAALNVPNGPEHVYLNSLMPPSFPANLIPNQPRRIDGQPVTATFYGQPDGSNALTPGADGYYPAYTPFLGLSGGATLSGKEVKRADQLISEINGALRDLVAAANATSAGPQFHLYDLESLGRRYDAKHHPTETQAYSYPLVFLRDPPEVRPSQGDLALNNWPSTSHEIKRRNWALRSGGLFSLDGMHLSSLGYAVWAEDLANEISRIEELPVDALGVARASVHPRQFVVLRSRSDQSMARSLGNIELRRGALRNVLSGFRM